MIKHTILIVIALFTLMISCRGTVESNNDFEIITIDNAKVKKVERVPWEEHKVLENTNQCDTLKLGHGLFSVIKAVYVHRASSDYEPDITYSNHLILLNKKVLYKRDSILAAGPFSIDHKATYIGFPVVRSQNQDSGVTLSDLVLLNTYTSQSRVIKTSINNNANPFFSLDGGKLFFIDGNALFCYVIGAGKITKVVEFEAFSGLILYMKPVSPTAFKIFYLKTLESEEIYESLISTKKPHFK